jgi:hypothetical protein
VAEWGALLRRCPGSPDRGFKSLPLRHMMATAVVIASFGMLLPLSPAAAATCTQRHTAKTNDSWTRIAARFDVPLKSLLQMNSARTSTPIFVGDRICVSLQPEITQPTTTYSRREVVAIIREVWPDDLEENALFVARRESNLVPGVVGGRNDCCVGLFQIYWTVHRPWLERAGVTDPSQLLDPRINTEAAFNLYKRNGNSWRPWWTSSWRP